MGSKPAGPHAPSNPALSRLGHEVPGTKKKNGNFRHGCFLVADAAGMCRKRMTCEARFVASVPAMRSSWSVSTVAVSGSPSLLGGSPRVEYAQNDLLCIGGKPTRSGAHTPASQGPWLPVWLYSPVRRILASRLAALSRVVDRRFFFFCRCCRFKWVF